MPREGFEMADVIQPKYREVNKNKWMSPKGKKCEL